MVGSINLRVRRRASQRWEILDSNFSILLKLDTIINANNLPYLSFMNYEKILKKFFIKPFLKR